MTYARADGRHVVRRGWGMRHGEVVTAFAVLVLLVGCSYEGQDALDDQGKIQGALRDADLTFESQRCIAPGSEEFTGDWRMRLDVDADGADVAAALDDLFDIDEHDDGWRVGWPRFGGFEGTISSDGTVELVAREVGSLSYIVGLAGAVPGPCDGGEFPSPQPSEQVTEPYVEAGIPPFRLWAHATAEGSSQGETDLAGSVSVTGGCVVLNTDGGQHPIIWPTGTTLVETIPPTIRLPDGRLVVAGSSVAGIGTYAAVEELPLEIPDGCLDISREVAVFDPADHVWITRDVTGP